MTMQRYGQYKDSGVAWLGEVPSHWGVKRLRFVAEINPSKSEVSHLPADTDVSFLPMEAIGEDGSLELDRVRPLADVQTGYTFFRNGDVAIAKITPCFENGKGAAMRDLCNGIGFGTTELIVTRPKATQTTSNYLHWLFTSRPFRKAGEAFMYGAGGQKRVPDDFVRDFAIGFPPLPEQQAIATFLDHETAKIDALVDEQRRLIALLKEKRQAVIAQAVTKGLDLNVPMKDSGVEWLGTVPAHWSVTRLGYFATVENGTTPSRDTPAYWTDGDVPWLSSGEVNRLYVDACEEFITQVALEQCSLRLLPAGTVSVGLIGQGKTRGMSALLRIDATINQNLAAICPGSKAVSAYVLYLFHAMYEWLREAGRGGNQAAMNCEILRSLRIPVPPVGEQIDIATAIDSQLAELDALRAEAVKAMTLLGERRAALISAAVTGKIDVRGAVTRQALSA